MKPIPGGVSTKKGCNEYVNYGGKAGKKAMGAKHTGIADGGKDTGPSATNSGEKFTNKMLSPGPAARKHS